MSLRSSGLRLLAQALVTQLYSRLHHSGDWLYLQSSAELRDGYDYYASGANTHAHFIRPSCTA